MNKIKGLLIIIIFSFSLIACNNKTVYHVGDIVLEDGSVMAPSELESYEGTARPMALIFSVTGGEHENSSRVLGVGLKASKGLVFAPEGSKGNETNVMENYSIVSAQEFNITDGVFYSEGFLGLLDGRNTWKNVLKYDAEAKESFAGYPAYKYAVNYGIDKGFKKFQKGWYLPTASEAVALSRCQLPDLPDLPDLPEIIWTSSQSYGAKNACSVVDLSKSYVEAGHKELAFGVCSIYCFAE